MLSFHDWAVQNTQWHGQRHVGTLVCVVAERVAVPHWQHSSELPSTWQDGCKQRSLRTGTVFSNTAIKQKCCFLITAKKTTWMLLWMRCIVTVPSQQCLLRWAVAHSLVSLCWLSLTLAICTPFLAHSSLSACHLQPQLSASDLRGALLCFHLVSECLSITSVLRIILHLPTTAFFVFWLLQY